MLALRLVAKELEVHADALDYRFNPGIVGIKGFDPIAKRLRKCSRILRLCAKCKAKKR